MAFTLTDLIEPSQTKILQTKIKNLQYQLDQAQKELLLINNKALKAKKPILDIESSARELRSMFEKEPDTLEKIIKHVVDTLKGQDDTIIEKQENSSVVEDDKPDEEVANKDVVEDVQQEVPEPTEDIADDTLAVENKVEDDNKVSSTNKKPDRSWTPPSKNSSTVGIIEREDKINFLVKNGLARINEFTNAVELHTFYEELHDKHPYVASAVQAGILKSVTNPETGAWDKYKTISENIPPGTPLEHDDGNYGVEILYYVRPCVDSTDDIQKYCDVLTFKGHPKVVSVPEHGSNTRLAVNARPPSSKVKKQIKSISSNQILQSKITKKLNSIDISEEINLVEDQPVLF